MRKVVDSNYLRDDALTAYLGRRPNNMVVLSEYTGMEAYTGDTLATLSKSMSVLMLFPKQVIVLKSTRALFRLSGKVKGLQRRMIDKSITADFPSFCKLLKAAVAGNAASLREILERAQKAEKLLRKVESSIASMTALFPKLARLYSSEERARIRTGRMIHDNCLEAVITHSVKLAAVLYGVDRRFGTLPPSDSLVDTYPFRFALCAQLLALRWAAFGGIDGASKHT